MTSLAIPNDSPLVADLEFERRGSGPPILLMHGLGSNLRVWDPVRARIESAHDTIVLNLPGHGASPPPLPTAADPESLARSVATFLDRVGIETAHLAGNSLGAWVALELAKMGRARSVTALAPAGLWSSAAPLYDVVTFRAYRSLSKIINRLLPLATRNPLARTILLGQFFGRPWAVPPEAALSAAWGFATASGFDSIFGATSRARFKGGRTITVPLTIVWGTREMLLLPWQSRRRDELPEHARWIVLPRCGHIPMYDDPDAVARVLLEGSGTEAHQQHPD